MSKVLSSSLCESHGTRTQEGTLDMPITRNMVQAGMKHRGIASYSGGTRGDGSEMLSSMLSTASPEIQKQMLGERLYPLVYQHELGSGDGVSQCVLGRRESMCNGDENHEIDVRDGQHEADFDIGITGIFGCQSGRSCAGAEAIKSDKCINLEVELWKDTKFHVKVIILKNVDSFTKNTTRCSRMINNTNYMLNIFCGHDGNITDDDSEKTVMMKEKR
ncbi:polyadenylate-binding protein 7 [Tanacetum coccineum]